MIITFITHWLVNFGVNPRWIRPLLFGAAFVLVVLFLIGAQHCVSERAERAQIKQTTKSSQAIAAAAKDAVNTVAKRSDVENELDAATAIAQRNIGNAQDPNAIRRGVLDALCVRDDRRNDPACKLRRAYP